MTRAILYFLLAFGFVQVILAVLVVFGVPIHNSMGVIAYMIALSPPIMDFVKREGRIMTPRERAIFALWAMLIAIVPSIILLMVIEGGTVIRELSREFAGQWRIGNMGMVALFVGIAVAVPATMWLAAYFTASSFGKQALKKVQGATKA
jgi:Ca2+/Na+ antiporter